MSWMKMLCQTYENNSELAGKSYESDAALSLVAHMSANAQLEITISGKGEFLGACEVPKENSSTIIPITEKSASRSSGIAPHPLCDTLSYIAGDYADYALNEKEKKKASDKFKAYSEALGMWAASEYSHPKINAICKYISNAQVISDLIKAGIVELKDDGTFSDKKIKGKAYDRALVRFRIVSEDTDGLSNATWEDASLFDCFTKYYTSTQNGRKDVCYIYGDVRTACVSHPKGIIAASYGAKLISSNDESGFTFRGRFNNPEEAYAVSYEATQKAHNALTWLAKNQSVYAGGRVYICWNPRGKPVPSTDTLFGFEDDNEETDRPLTEPAYAKRLQKALDGYSDVLDDNDDIALIALDAATTGRLSVTNYSELKASDFLRRFKNWAETCRWYYPEFTQDKRLFYEIRSPLARRTVEYAFGTEQEKYIKVNASIMREQYQRIIHCMFDEQPVPRDIVHALAVKASNRSAYSSFINYENVLSTACAYIVKYYLSKDVKYEMTLDCNNTDRSYLFGRLLAIAERVERSTYSTEENREPNAIRLQPAFVHHPMHTWKDIDLALNPYMQRLTPGLRRYYRNLIEGIFELICENDINILNKSLDDSYLIGYYLQRAVFKKTNNKTDKQEDK